MKINRKLSDKIIEIVRDMRKKPRGQIKIPLDIPIIVVNKTKRK